MENFLLNISVAVISGLLLTLIIFFLKEYIFSKKNLSGEWTSRLKIDQTEYGKYKDLEIYYDIHLLQKGYEIVGTGEKIKEINSHGETTKYEPEKRVTIEVDGYYEHKYISKSKVYLNIIEDGKLRESRKTYYLEIANKKELKGRFGWTAADSKGKVNMEKVL